MVLVTAVHHGIGQRLANHLARQHWLLQALQLAFVAEISDGAGNVLPGSAAQWEIATPGSIALSNVVGVADANGRVSALGTLGQLAGQNIVRVRSGTASAQFTFTVNITITTMNKIQGDG